MKKFLRKLKFQLTPKRFRKDHFASRGVKKQDQKVKPGILYILRGLPASGKSTHAKDMMSVKENEWYRVNKDLLRTMLHFDEFTGKRDRVTHDVSVTLVRKLVAEGKNVIVDDTNLNPRTHAAYMGIVKDLGCDYGDHLIDTPMELCIQRDSQRDKNVGEDVIKRMALMAGLYPHKEFIIYDIDGTVADLSHRKHFLESGKKDWDSFFKNVSQDSVRMETFKMYRTDIDMGKKVIFVSGRPEKTRIDTETWLLDNYFEGYETLLMRQDHDKRPDVEVKQDIYDKYLKKYAITKVVDDRPSVICMWRSNFLNVVDVGDGKEF